MDHVFALVYGPYKVCYHPFNLIDQWTDLDLTYSIGNAKISGMETDLNLTSDQYSTALVVFFVGYVVFEVPSKYVVQKSTNGHYMG